MGPCLALSVILCSGRIFQRQCRRWGSTAWHLLEVVLDRVAHWSRGSGLGAGGLGEVLEPAHWRRTACQPVARCFRRHEPRLL
eukprot:11399710-Heterocapsa_arctica.AAC.1